MNKLPDFIQYDAEADVLIIHGIRYAKALFETMATCRSGARFELYVKENGVITVKELPK